MNLTLLILIPFITAILILLVKGLQQIRIISLAGAVAQLGLASWLLKLFLTERATGNKVTYLFESNQFSFEL
jgi:NADH:ubiquinone oxidoreductase subunit 4 (subunit M)